MFELVVPDHLGRQQSRWAMMRLRIIFLAFGIAACRTQHITQSPMPTTSELPPEKWIAIAEFESRRFLTPLCTDILPPALSRSTLERDCIRRVERAIESDWNSLYENALHECVRTGATSCCFSSYAPGPEYDKRKTACDSECVRLAGDGAPTPRGDVRCISHNVGLRKARTPADVASTMDNVLDQCAVDAHAITLCDTLPSWGLRRQCGANCLMLDGYRHAYKGFVGVVDECVAKAPARGIACAPLDEPATRQGFSAERCELACYNEIHGRRWSWPRPEADSHHGR